MAMVQILAPLVFALWALAIKSETRRPLLLPANAVLNLALTALALAGPSSSVAGRLLALDEPGRLVLLLVSTLYLMCAVYAVGYLRLRAERPNRVFCACLLALPGFLNWVAWSNHLGLMWVAMEATTLTCGPLIYFNHSDRSIEATWKYLLVGSVGIALALMGSFFMAYAVVHSGREPSLLFEDLMAAAPGLSRPWLHGAFVLLLVGYGTKMGVAPMHTWKPDAYGEAPGLVGAMLAGGVTSGAFLAILRIYRICVAAGEGAYAQRMLVLLGLLSMAIAAAFMVQQRDFKRMLAYSSVEHMGILLLGIGLGGAGVFGSLLHLINNGLTKGVMFLSAGNIHRAYDSKNADLVSGAFSRVPVSAGLFMAGFIAVTGSPPFAPFVSEFTIFKAAITNDAPVAGSLYLIFLAIIFVGMSMTVLRIVTGSPPTSAWNTSFSDSLLTVLPIGILMAAVLVLGVYLPPPLENMVRAAAASIIAP